MLPHRISSEISLELLEPRHASELFALTDANREHLRGWMPWVDGTQTVDDTKAFIEVTRTQLAANSGFQTAIRLRDRLVGVVGLHRVDWSNRFTSIGYWLARDAQGQGIMIQSCRAYVEHAFGALELHRIEIRCAVENAKSRAIPERLGFHFEGVIRDGEWLYDHFVDHVVYGILSTEWERPNNALERTRNG
jgi:ribosomal-protein-serine acetyltransferase